MKNNQRMSLPLLIAASLAGLVFGVIFQTPWLSAGILLPSKAEPEKLEVSDEPAATAVTTPVKTTHKEAGALGRRIETKIGELSSLCMDREGNLLACDQKAKVVKVISPEDKLIRTLKLTFAPTAIACASNGDIFAGGEKGEVVRMDKDGKTLKTSIKELPTNEVTSIAVGEKNDLFVTTRSNRGYGVYRSDTDLGEAKKIIDGLSGCCGQMDVTWGGGNLYVAENGYKRIVRYDRDGKKLDQIVKDNRKDPDWFGGCCNPKNICIAPNGDIFASESEGRIRRLKADGSCAAEIARVKAEGCLRVTVAASKDGSRVYMLDSQHNTIRVIEGPAAK
ncbi:MAG: hypothetical protein NTX50_22870 [Candidatus Sumerlaeota bacterium]|nr:hypothetical protein [Candidatus Sumerlaeota bacterium]